MANKADIKEAEERVQFSTKKIREQEEGLNFAKKCGLIGMAGLAYCGIRSIWFDFDFNQLVKEDYIYSIVDYVDCFAAVIGNLFAGLSPLYGGFFALEKKVWEKDLQKEKENLEKITQDYQFSRGHQNP